MSQGKKQPRNIRKNPKRSNPNKQSKRTYIGGRRF